MKKLMIILLCCISFAAKSQDTTKLAIPDSSKLTLLKVYNDTNAGITGLAAALKQPAIHVYEVLIKQQVVNSIMYIIIIIMLFIVCLRLWGIFRRNCARTKDKEDSWYTDDLSEHAGLIGVLIISVIVSIGCLATFCATAEVIVTGFVNPEYGAIKEIINFVK